MSDFGRDRRTKPGKNGLQRGQSGVAGQDRAADAKPCTVCGERQNTDTGFLVVRLSGYATTVYLCAGCVGQAAEYLRGKFV